MSRRLKTSTVFWREKIFAEVEVDICAKFPPMRMFYSLLGIQHCMLCAVSIVDLQPVKEDTTSTKCFCKLTPFPIHILPLISRLAIHDKIVDDFASEFSQTFKSQRLGFVCAQHCFVRKKKKKRLRRDTSLAWRRYLPGNTIVYFTCGRDDNDVVLACGWRYAAVKWYS